MVSRILSSITNLFTAADHLGPDDQALESEGGVQGSYPSKVNLQSTPGTSQGPVTPSPSQRKVKVVGRSRSNSKHGSETGSSRDIPSLHRREIPGSKFISAETLDKAIVTRLQVKVPDIFDTRKSSEGLRSGTPRSGSRGKTDSSQPCTFSYKDAYLNTMNGCSRPSSKHFLTTGESIPNSSRFNMDGGETNGDPSDPRGIVFKNRQFNLDNSSREALCSGSRKSVVNDEDVAGGAPSEQFHQSLFGSLKDAARVSSLDRELETTRRRSRSRSPSRAVGFTPSFSNCLGEHLFESTMNEIIDKGGDEFKNKYSAFVWDSFRGHLEKMKETLLVEFSQKMQDALEERENEVTDLQQQYREKLLEFEKTSQGFQKMVDNLYQENQRVLLAKDVLIDKLKSEFMLCKKHFEQDLLRQMQSYRKEAEVEKLELQKRNDELMMIMMTESSRSGLQDSFKREIDSLHKMIRTLTVIPNTNQNDGLNQQLGNFATSATTSERKMMDSFQSQLDQTRIEMESLQKRLQQAEREKEDITVSYHQEIAKLNRKMQESSTRYDHQIKEAFDEVEAVRRKYAKETKDLKHKISAQEVQYSQMLGHVKNQYGGQVDELSKVVSQLQMELTVAGSAYTNGNGNGNRKFAR